MRIYIKLQRKECLLISILDMIKEYLIETSNFNKNLFEFYLNKLNLLKDEELQMIKNNLEILFQEY